MNLIKPPVLTEVVENDLCVGCGACVQACPSKALGINWSDYGFLVATTTDNACDGVGACIEVCPFNPEPGPEYKNEDGLAAVFLSEAPNHHPKMGRYHAIYVGYSNKHRDTSSSGGIATFVYEKLFDKGLINHVVTVGESKSTDAHYQYNIVSSKDELPSISKTRYHPVTLAAALETIKQLEGRVAISGIGCFIKAVRLAQDKNPVLKEKIVFTVGIICGGLKSKFFTDYLASSAGAALHDFSKPEYRVKDPASTASDYGFSCTDNPSNTTKLIKMREVGDMWGSGLFKANACDFCDDVTTELADISLGDAWLPPYNQDGKGHNVVVSRSLIAEQILQAGLENGELELESLLQERFLASQQGSFNHRHDGMSTRIDMAKRTGAVIPPKRVDKHSLPLYLKAVQIARRCTRAHSLEVWEEYRNARDFNRHMKQELLKLKLITRFSHAVRKAKILIGAKA
ncbi:Coenzyme F420 hydrogenase/dehydrogenase, beta subunit C-terminal domain [Stutzerimonas stutzeri]|uniref:Coenzyme F420 hydrogenase/dehydrogenase, beta subunit C-terminal domain n=1 Tax=Stutzerimonas stutzeri TaxID=316 RepID=UPI0024B81764|nr:Coenzyme F420 hydrogenase/dehydrogenase, beta subunit C-terminal domain [Stutzerimonas stutzeri]MDI9738111.1 Coenzyme F420 hydrogenase/dehydrogenase, beta subunit C-terminal domain [Stutzerimonas stutzeri]